MKNDLFSFYRFMKKHHTGQKNAIISKELERKYHKNKWGIYYFVTALRKMGIPICSCWEGYFFPERYSEVAETVTRFEKYGRTLAATGKKMLNSKF